MFFIAGDKLEWIMKQMPQIVLAAALIMAGTTFATAQNGLPTGYPPAAKNPNFGYGYYDYYVGPGYGQPYYGTPYGYPGYSYDYPGYTYGYTGAPGWR
jgi:hypothetical protein